MAATAVEQETRRGAELEVGVEVDEERYLRRVRRSSIVIVVLVLVAAVIVGGRTLIAAEARSQIEVQVVPRSLTCAPLGDGSPGTTPGGRAIVVEGMDCEVAFTLTNDGPLSVQLDTITVRAAGAESGSVIQAVELRPGGNQIPAVQPVEEPGEVPFAARAIDAVFEVGRTLEPHETIEYRFVVAHHAEGCAPRGSAATLGPPTAQVRAFGQKGEREGTGIIGPFFSRTDLNEC